MAVGQAELFNIMSLIKTGIRQNMVLTLSLSLLLICRVLIALLTKEPAEGALNDYICRQSYNE